MCSLRHTHLIGYDLCPRWRLLQACDCCRGDYQRHKLLHRKLSSNRTLLKTLYIVAFIVMQTI